MSATALRTASDQHRRATRNLERSVVRTVWRLGVYFWIAVVLVSALVTVLAARGDGSPDGAVGEGTFGAARYFLIVMGIILAAGVLPVHLAAGGSRRSFLHGMLRSGAALAVTYALAGAVLMLVQTWIYHGYDWSTAVPDGSLYDDSGDFLGIWLAWTILSMAYFVAGAAIALTFARFQIWLGLAVSAGVVVLVIGVETALRGGSYGAQVADVLGIDVSSLIGVLIALALTAALGWILHRLGRDIGVKPLARGVAARGC